MSTFIIKQQFSDISTANPLTVFVALPNKQYPLTVYLCNREAVATTFRIAIAVGGASDDLKQYIYYDAPLPANDALKETFTLSDGDELRVYSPSARVSCSVFVDQAFELLP